MELSLAGALCLSRHHRRVSLHGRDVGAFDRVAVDQSVGSHAEFDINLADAFRRGARVRSGRAGLVGDF